MPDAFLEQLIRFCPCCGSAGFAQPQPRFFRCGQCDFQFYLNNATAVGAFIADEEGRVLLIQRAKDPGKGLFGLPGGFVDAGETAEEAVRREAREEVNLELVDLVYLVSSPNRYTFRGVVYRVTDFFYAARARNLSHLSAEVEEVSGHLFRHPREIDPASLAFDSFRVALRAYREHLGELPRMVAG